MASNRSKLLWTRVTLFLHSFSRSWAASRAAWSRSTQMRRPVVSRRAISRLWPARPKVPSQIDPVGADIQRLNALLQEHRLMRPYLFHTQNPNSLIQAAIFSGVISSSS